MIDDDLWREHTLDDETTDREDELLGLVMQSRQLADQLDLAPEDFLQPKASRLWEMIRATPRDEPVDPVSMAELWPGDDRYPMHCAQCALGAVPETARAYAKILQRRAWRRRVCESAREVLRVAHTRGADDDEILSASHRLSTAVSGQTRSEVHGADDFLPEIVDVISRRENGVNPFLSTGLPDVDQMLGGGLEGGQLVIVAGRPSMGKTALAQAISRGIWETHQRSSMVVSLEMRERDLEMRELSASTNIPLSLLRTGDIARDYYPRLMAAMDRRVGKHLLVTTRARDVHSVLRDAIGLKAKHPLGAIVIDYLQIMTIDDNNGRTNFARALGMVTTKLKELAMLLDLPVILLSQLSRRCEERADKRPMMSDLRESGAIEQDADVILFLYRKSQYHQTDYPQVAEAICAKNRQGPTGVAYLKWDASHVRFCSIDPDTKKLYREECRASTARKSDEY